MKSIKLMFLIGLIEMISLTSCTSEAEQTKQEVKSEISFQKGTDLTEDQKEALDISIGEVERTNSAERRAKVKCTKGMAAFGNVYYNSCVSINGQMYAVDLTYNNGDLISWHCTESSFCDCSFD
jgi:hypothetical protein